MPTFKSVNVLLMFTQSEINLTSWRSNLKIPTL